MAEGIPELRKIVGMRNRIIHGYDAVDDELVWLTAMRTAAPIGTPADLVAAHNTLTGEHLQYVGA